MCPVVFRLPYTLKTAASCPLHTYRLSLLTRRFMSTSYPYTVSSFSASCPLRTHRLSPHLPIHVHFVSIDSVSSPAPSCPLRKHEFNVVAYHNKFPEFLPFKFLLVVANSPSASFFFSKVRKCAVNFVENSHA
jgi:hypothetical protein